MGTRNYFDKETTLDFIRMRLGGVVSGQTEDAESGSQKLFSTEIEALERHFNALFLEGFETVFREKVKSISSNDLNLTDASEWFRDGQDDGLIYKYFEYFIEQDDKEWADIELYALAERDWQAASGNRPEAASSETAKSGVERTILSQSEVAEFTQSALGHLKSTEEAIRILEYYLARFREGVGSSDRMSALEDLGEIIDLQRIIAERAEYARYRTGGVQRQVIERIEAEGFASANELNPFARQRYEYHWQCLNNLSIGMANIFE